MVINKNPIFSSNIVLLFNCRFDDRLVRWTFGQLCHVCLKLSWEIPHKCKFPKCKIQILIRFTQQKRFLQCFFQSIWKDDYKFQKLFLIDVRAIICRIKMCGSIVVTYCAKNHNIALNWKLGWLATKMNLIWYEPDISACVTNNSSKLMNITNFPSFLA